MESHSSTLRNRQKEKLFFLTSLKLFCCSRKRGEKEETTSEDERRPWITISCIFFQKAFLQIFLSPANIEKLSRFLILCEEAYLASQSFEKEPSDVFCRIMPTFILITFIHTLTTLSLSLSVNTSVSFKDSGQRWTWNNKPALIILHKFTRINFQSFFENVELMIPRRCRVHSPLRA